MHDPKRPPQGEDVLHQPSTGRTIDVDPAWLHEGKASPPPIPKNKTMEVDPAWLEDSSHGAQPPQAAAPSAKKKGPPPVPEALLRKKPLGKPIPRDDDAKK